MRKVLVRERIASTWLEFRREIRQVLCSWPHLALVFETITSSFSFFFLLLLSLPSLLFFFSLLLLEYLSAKNYRRHRPTRSTLRSRRHLMVFYRRIDEHVWSSALNNSTKIQYLGRASCSSLARPGQSLNSLPWNTTESFWHIMGRSLFDPFVFTLSILCFVVQNHTCASKLFEIQILTASFD